MNLEYWRKLCPELTVSANAYQLPVIETAVQDVIPNIIQDGYFHVPFDEWNLPLDKMASCIFKLRCLDIDPVWCFVYDEFWILTTRIHSYINSLLGDKYHKLPDMWAWYIDPVKKERGWDVHRDRHHGCTFDNGMPRSLTVWIPLTDATLDNGCMHVVPMTKDPNSKRHDDLYYADWEEHFYRNEEVALPCKAGDLLGWNQQTLHWGGSATNTNASPRISVSVEFVADAVLSEHDDVTYPIKTWLDPFLVPSLDEKINLIDSLYSRYQHMWTSDDRNNDQ